MVARYDEDYEETTRDLDSYY